MKRIIAFILTIISLFNVIAFLSGCSSKESSITKGEVLALINEGFGMDYYSDSEPYTKTVKKDDKYFADVQIAFEWDVINDVDININDKATKGFLAEALVKCVGLINIDEMSSDEITEYAVNNNYVSFNYRGRTDNIRYVTANEVEESIALSIERWTNRKIENKEEISVGDDVINLADGDISSKDFFVDKTNNTIILPKQVVTQLKEGDSFVVPANNSDKTAAAYKAERIEFENGYAIVHTNVADVENTIEELQFSGSATPNLSSVPITDGVGNVVNSGQIDSMAYSNSIEPAITNLAYSNNDYQIIPCSSAKIGFKVDGIDVSGSVSDDSVSFAIKGDIVTNSKKGTKVTVNKSYEVKNISLDYDWDIEWFKIKYAYAKLNYTTVDTTGVSFSWSKEGAGFADQRGNHGKDENGVSWWKPSFNDCLTSDVRSAAAAKGAKTITICSFPIVNGGIGRIDLDIKAKISITGSVELVVTTRNANGIEYKNGNIRYIKEKSTDTDLNIKAKIEGTLYIGVSIKALGMNLLGVGLEAGLGVEFKTTAHLVNSDNVEMESVSLSGNGEYVEAAVSSLQNVTYSEDGKTLTVHVDLCGDITTYFILRFKFDDDCALADLLNGKKTKSGGVINLEIEIFGKSNASIKELCTHIEDWKFIDKCTRKYDGIADEDANEDESEALSETSSNTDDGNKIDLDTYYLNLLVGNTEKLSVTQLPNGYGIDKVVYTSSNPDVATVDNTGKITAIKEGTTEIVVSIPNTAFKMSCSVTVNSSAENQFQGINLDI